MAGAFRSPESPGYIGKKPRSPTFRLELTLCGERDLGKEASVGGAEEVNVLVSRCAVAIVYRAVSQCPQQSSSHPKSDRPQVWPPS